MTDLLQDLQKAKDWLRTFEEVPPVATPNDAFRMCADRIQTIIQRAEAEKAGNSNPSVQDMGMLIRMLANRLTNVEGESALLKGTLDYMDRHDLNGSPLRSGDAEAEQPSLQEALSKNHHEWYRLVEAANGGTRPFCRDCADRDGYCHDGLPCDLTERAEVQIRAALQRPRVPDGWKMVPVNVSDQMYFAVDAIYNALERDEVEKIWRAMLAAAPEPGGQ